MIQGTPEWFEARRGKITGTGFSKVLSKRGNTRTDYMRQLILERKTGISAETYSNEAMEWGTVTEPQARSYYEKINGVGVRGVGFIDFEPMSEAERVEFGNYVGCSPDGLVGDGIIEIKCPDTKTHLEYIAKNKLPSKYIPQVQGNMWVIGANWCDFISFDPRVEKQPYWCIRVERDEQYIANLAQEVSKFIDEMLKMQIEIQDVDPKLLMDVTGGCSEDDWVQMKQMEIRGRCRHGISCALLSNPTTNPDILDINEEKINPKLKTFINAWVDFIVTGE